MIAATVHPARPTAPRQRHRRGVTLTDLCVLLASVVLVGGAVVPLVSFRTGRSDSRIKCASNLRQIAMAAIMYAVENPRNGGKFSRTYYDPGTADKPALYTGTDSPKSFADDPADPIVPKPNDVTAAFYLLLKSSDLTSDTFNCPSSEATRLGADAQALSNWPGGPKHLSYSYNNPYPTKQAREAGWKFDTTLSPDYPLAADMNYGDNDKGGPTKVAYNARREQMASANSANHWFEGQYVGYVDAHVEWQTTPFAGPPKPGRAWRDNIYASAVGVDEATGTGGVVHGGPVEPTDSVLLPTAFDAPAGAVGPAAPAVLRKPGMSRPFEPDRRGLNATLAVVAVVAGGLLVVALAVLWSRRGKVRVAEGATETLPGTDRR